VNRYLRSRRKRALDVAGAALGLLLAAPLLALAALAIRLEGGGHFIYRQRRVGRDGVPFDLYKLRTMVTGAETMGSGLIVDAGDDRITKVGALLRRTSLDELPQILNIIKGDMSLVGPRPPIPSEVDGYQRWQRRRLSMKPGITCLWQVSGRNRIDFEEWMRLDLKYIDTWSLWLDLKILLRTIPAVLTGRGAS